MRKIISKQQEDRKRKRNQLVVGIILIAVMFFSVFGYGFLNTKEEGNKKKIVYNGFEFEKQNDFWMLRTKGGNFIFQYNPNEVEKININSYLTNIDKYYGKPLYIFSEDDIVELEVYRNLNSIVQRIQRACLNGEGCVRDMENLPNKTCEDNFIIIKEANYSEISQQENCVFIYGQQENLTKLTDEFLFKILGITE